MSIPRISPDGTFTPTIDLSEGSTRECPTITAAKKAMETDSFKRFTSLHARMWYLLGYLETDEAHWRTTRIIEKLLRGVEHERG